MSADHTEEDIAVYFIGHEIVCRSCLKEEDKIISFITKQLQDNIDALKNTEFSTDELNQIDAVLIA